MNFRREIVFAGILFVTFIALPLPALSQSEGPGGQALDQAANDPTASS